VYKRPLKILSESSSRTPKNLDHLNLINFSIFRVTQFPPRNSLFIMHDEHLYILLFVYKFTPSQITIKQQTILFSFVDHLCSVYPSREEHLLSYPMTVSFTSCRKGAGGRDASRSDSTANIFHVYEVGCSIKEMIDNNECTIKSVKVDNREMLLMF
jgi:hypothetical protein